MNLTSAYVYGYLTRQQFIEAKEMQKPANEWIAIKSAADLPEKPGIEDYEQIECLIYHNGEIYLRMWNCEHLVWDGEDGDDFYCNATEPKAYMIIDRAGLVQALKPKTGHDTNEQ